MNHNVNLVILAAGSATRMLPIHQNLYPKILTNLGNEVQIQKIIESYPFASSVTIIVADDHQKNQVKEMLDALEIFDVYLIAANVGACGTLATPRKVMADHQFHHKNVLLTWSDICPKQPIKEFDTTRNVCFTDRHPRHRLNFEQGKWSMSPSQQGNVVGLYFIKDLMTYLAVEKYPFENGTSTDLAEVFREYDQEFHQLITSFHDVGEVDKYEAYLKLVDIKQRFFNDVKIGYEFVTKTALNTRGKVVLRNELEFYNALNEEQRTVFPTVAASTDDSFKMTRVVGSTVHETVKIVDETYDDINFARSLFEKFDNAVSILHSVKGETVYEAVKREYFDVPLERIRKISAILPFINNVNGVDVNEVDVIKLVEQVHPLLVDDFRMIHGDPNTSNTMLTDAGTLQFIDPRGQFGGNKTFGDAKYDHAKFLYGLTGYDHFNLTKDVRFDYASETCEIAYNCIDGYNLDELTDDPKLKYLVGLIWYKLPYYTIQNINKAIVAYAHGLQLITKYGPQVLALQKS